MPTTEERIRKLVADNLEVDGKPISESVDLNVSLTDLGVSSLNIVAFARLIQQEFDMKFEVEHCAELNNLAEVIEFLDSQAA